MLFSNSSSSCCSCACDSAAGEAALPSDAETGPPPLPASAEVGEERWGCCAPADNAACSACSSEGAVSPACGADTASSRPAPCATLCSPAFFAASPSMLCSTSGASNAFRNESPALASGPSPLAAITGPPGEALDGGASFEDASALGVPVGLSGTLALLGTASNTPPPKPGPWLALWWASAEPSGVGPLPPPRIACINFSSGFPPPGAPPPPGLEDEAVEVGPPGMTSVLGARTAWLLPWCGGRWCWCGCLACTTNGGSPFRAITKTCESSPGWSLGCADATSGGGTTPSGRETPTGADCAAAASGAGCTSLGWCSGATGPAPPPAITPSNSSSAFSCAACGSPPAC
mmetsp:Transcript_14384/g.35890  ORF Transcript_14384/g.35890 Transcript_14384/m.35890 type:complete len:347 (-) Transcript_14384:499-1539(-)